MSSSQKLFGSRKLIEFEKSEISAENSSREFSKASQVPPELGFTLSADASLSCPPDVAQALHSLGYSPNQMKDTLDSIQMLCSATGRCIRPVTFAKIHRRYKVKRSALVALASLCTQDAADLGLVLRSFVRFYKRNGFKEEDLDLFERYAKWVVSRGEIIIGVPSSFDEYCRLHKITNKARKSRKK